MYKVANNQNINKPSTSGSLTKDIGTTPASIEIFSMRRINYLPHIRNMSSLSQWGLTSFIFFISLAGCSSNVKHSASNFNDPSEHINRKVFAFNKALDKAVVKPVARGYSHFPKPVKNGVQNFTRNFESPGIFVNDLLQANFLRSATTGGRFIVNSTVGVIGIFDVAKHLGMPYHNADFGQTFGVWGLGSGRPIELPIFGASNTRDTFGKVFGLLLISPIGSNSSTVADLDIANSVGGTVDGRARALPKTDELEKSADYYAGLRDLNTRRRQRFVQEGKIGALQEPHDDINGRPASGVTVQP